MKKRNLLRLTIAAVVTLTPAFSASPEESAVLRVEEAFRQAKLHNDVKALGQILAEGYNGVNQWGARRDKSSLIELFRDFPIETLTNGATTVRITGDMAIVDGTMTETGPGGSFKNMIFSRVYVKRDGRWQLWSSVQMMPLDRP